MMKFVFYLEIVKAHFDEQSFLLPPFLYPLDFIRFNTECDTKCTGELLSLLLGRGRRR